MCLCACAMGRVLQKTFPVDWTSFWASCNPQRSPFLLSIEHTFLTSPLTSCDLFSLLIEKKWKNDFVKYTRDFFYRQKWRTKNTFTDCYVLYWGFYRKNPLRFVVYQKGPKRYDSSPRDTFLFIFLLLLRLAAISALTCIYERGYPHSFFLLHHS